MYKLMRIAFVLSILLATFAIPFPAHAQGGNPTKYYVSVGTSLAAGIQVDKKTGAPILTDDAYTDQIHQRIKGQIQNLEHIKLGCPSETSQNMKDGIGSWCYTSAKSQLQTAEEFLNAHPGEIAFITIDIGANDVLPCLSLPNIEAIQTYVGGALGTLGGNLGEILARLQAAAPGVPIIGVNYYNPYLASWLQGPEGEAFALASNSLVVAINSVLKYLYVDVFKLPMADVGSAFETYNFTPNGNLPKNVKVICQLTWNCDYGNIHPNDNGYKVIAKTVEELMKSLGLL